MSAKFCDKTEVTPENVLVEGALYAGINSYSIYLGVDVNYCLRLMNLSTNQLSLADFNPKSYKRLPKRTCVCVTSDV